MLTQDSKNRIWSFTEQITGLALKVGVPLLIVSVVYLALALFGKTGKPTAKMTPAELSYFLNCVSLATKALTWSCVAVVASLLARHFYEELVGQLLSVVGAAFYFGTPAVFGNVVNGKAALPQNLLVQIMGAFCAMGAIALLPGVFLVVRDCILRIWRGMSVKRVLDYRWGDEEERRRKHKKRAVLGNCWQMAYCRPFVRDVCPAFASKKSCWRIKSGCYCDENTILKAMAGKGTENEHYKGILESLGLNTPARNRISAKVKRARCRRCAIFAEHQRQKYKVLSPMVFPATALVFYLYRSDITGWLAMGLRKADRFLNFLASSSFSGYNIGTNDQVMITLATIWLAIVVVSYALRALEYLIFDLQV